MYQGKIKGRSIVVSSGGEAGRGGEGRMRNTWVYTRKR